MARKILMVPGIGGSSRQHWQSLWQRGATHPVSFLPLTQEELDAPRRERWLAALNEELQLTSEDTLIVAHSLGVLAVVHWAVMRGSPVVGALLVSPPDPEGRNFPAIARSFAPVPLEPLPFPTIVAVSSNDPYISIAASRDYARAWGSRLVAVGALGHIGENDDLGEWAAGRELLTELMDE